MITLVWIEHTNAQTTEPSVWEVRKRGPGGCGIPKPRSTSLRPAQTSPPEQKKRPKMSDDSLSKEPFDYCNDVVPEVPPNHTTNAFIPRHGAISSLDLEIVEKQLQLLQWRRAVEMQEPGVSSSTYSASEMTESFGQPSYSRDQSFGRDDGSRWNNNMLRRWPFEMHGDLEIILWRSIWEDIHKDRIAHCG